MERIIITALLLSLFPAVANADDRGAWVVVDANGIVVSQAIVCTPDVCGNPNSEIYKMFVSGNNRFVQQSASDPVTGNVAGIGNNNPNTQVSVDNSSVWTITRTAPDSTTIVSQSQFQFQDSRTVAVVLTPVETITVASLLASPNADFAKRQRELITKLQAQIASMKQKRKVRK